SYGSAAAAPVTTGLDDAALERRVLADASLILGLELRPGSLRGLRRARWDFEKPGTGHGGTAPLLPPGWELAGDWVSGTGLASVVPGARAAARRILDPPQNASATQPTPAAQGTSHHRDTHPERSPQ
ncbi:MAG: hypothetical protein ACK5LO_09345, partial [Leucobacter sp.]